MLPARGNSSSTELLAESPSDVKFDQSSDLPQEIPSKIVSSQQDEVNVETIVSSEKQVMIPTRKGSSTEVLLGINQLDQTQGNSSIITEQENVEISEEISAEEKLLIQMREQSLNRDVQIETSLEFFDPQQDDVVVESHTSPEELLLTPTKASKKQKSKKKVKKEGSATEILDESPTDIHPLDQTSDQTQEIPSIATEHKQVELPEEISTEKILLIQQREQSLTIVEQIDEPSLNIVSSPKDEISMETVVSSEEQVLIPTREESATEILEESPTDIDPFDQSSDQTQEIPSIATEQEQVEIPREISSEEILLIEQREQSLTIVEQIDEPSPVDPQDNVKEELLLTRTTVSKKQKSKKHVKKTKHVSFDEPNVESEKSTSSDDHSFDNTSIGSQNVWDRGLLYSEVVTQNLPKPFETVIQSTESNLEQNVDDKSLEENLLISTREVPITEILEESPTDIHPLDQSPDQTPSIATEQKQVELPEEISTEEILLIQQREQYLTIVEQIDEPSLNIVSSQQDEVNLDTVVSSEEQVLIPTREESATVILEESPTDIQPVEQSSDQTQGIPSVATEQEQVDLLEGSSVEEILLIQQREQSLTIVEQIVEPSLTIVSSQQDEVNLDTVVSSEEQVLIPAREGSTTKTVEESPADFEELDQTSDRTQGLSGTETVLILKTLAVEKAFDLRSLQDAERQYFEQIKSEELCKSKASITFGNAKIQDKPKMVDCIKKESRVQVETSVPVDLSLSNSFTTSNYLVELQCAEKHYYELKCSENAENEESEDSSDKLVVDSQNVWNRDLLYSEVVAQNLTKARETQTNKNTDTKLEQNERCEDQPVLSGKESTTMGERGQNERQNNTRKDDVNDIVLESPVIESYSKPFDKIVAEIQLSDSFDLNNLLPFIQDESLLNKSVIDNAECLYYTLKSKQDEITFNEVKPDNNYSNDNVKQPILKSKIITQETIDIMQPAEENVDETNRQPKCAANKLTITSSVLNIPMKHGITNSDDPATPKRPAEHHSLGSTNNVALNCSEQCDPESTISKQILPIGVENILESLLSAELKMNNLPYDNINDLIKGLQALIQNLADYKQQNYAISMSLPPNADSKIQESVRQIDDRIDFLRQRAHDGLVKIQQTLKLREQRKKEVQSYILLLEETESWLSTTLIQLDDVDDNTSEDDRNQMLHRNQNLLSNLIDKETKAREIYAKTDEFLAYSDVCDRTMLLKENLGVIIRTMREKALILENNIQRLNQKQEPMASTLVNTEMQTSPPVSLEVFSRAPVEQQDTSSQTHKTGSTDNILIIQSVSNGQETVQISNVRNTSLMGTLDDIIVEAKYIHPHEGEAKKSSELLLQNIPSQFESTFVEPDESTTEIVVDKDGSKKITLRKTIQPIESIGPCEISSTSTLDVIILPPVIDGRELVVQETKSVSEEVDVASNIVGEILDNIQSDVVSTVDKKESEPMEQDSQVFESDALKVDLIASVVDSPSTSKVFSLQSTSETYSNLPEKIDSKINTPVVELVDEIWPPSTFINTGEFGRNLKTNDTTLVRTIQSDVLKPDSVYEEIWPQSLDTGSNYIDIAPQFPTMQPHQETQDASNVINLNQTEKSKSILDTATKSQEISEIRQDPIEEVKQQVSSEIVCLPAVEEKLEEEILSTEIEQPSADNVSIMETSTIQIEPSTVTADEGKESRSDDLIISEEKHIVTTPVVESYETERMKVDVIEEAIASPPEHILSEAEERCDSIPVVEPCDIEHKDEVITTEAKPSSPDIILSEEKRDSIPVVESYASESNNEDKVTESEMPCDDKKDQHTYISQSTCESDGKLEVQVASTKEEQSSLKLTMNIVPLDAKKISVSLIEVGHAESKPVPTDAPSSIEKSKLSEDLLTSEKIPGLSDIDYDKGYEADKTTVDAESGSDETQKKKKRKKKKPRNETEKAINTEMLEPSEEPSGEIAVIDSRSEEQEINVTQEGIVNEPNETSSYIQERIIVTTEVIEAIYVEDVQQQTTPVEFEHPDFGLDQEVSKITSEKLLVPIDFEPKSMQTSPEPETLKMSHQTSPIQTEAVESEAKEIQTTMEVFEIETQTLNTTPKHQTEQASQTEVNTSEYMDKSAATPVIDVVDMANQTITHTTEMEIQTMENFGEIVEPIVTNIINSAINDEIIYKQHSVQTSPISFEPTKEESVAVLHESIQTVEPEILDAHVGTEQILREKSTSPVYQEPKSDAQIQTSPVHEPAIVLEQSYAPKASVVENVNQDTQTSVVSVVDNQAQTNQEPTTNVSQAPIPSTEKSPANSTKSEKKKKKTKKTKSDGKVPLQVEVSAQFEVPDSSAEVETFTVTKTVISEANIDSKNNLDIHVHLDIDPLPQRSESLRINEVISDEKIVSLGLHNYLSILKSQQNYAEHKQVPWSEMAGMLEYVYRAGNSPQTQYQHTARTTTSADDENQYDYLGLERALHSLQENSTDAAAQNLVCFEILESISAPTEEIITDLNKLQNLNHTDCLRMCRIYKQRLIYMLTIIQKIIIYIKSNSTQLNPDVVKCFELTANELRQLDSEITRLETESRQKQAYTDNLLGTLHDVNAQFASIDENLSNIIYDETVSISKKLLQLDELEQQYLECARRLRTVSIEFQTLNKTTFDNDLETLLESADKKSRKLAHSFIMERNKLNQLNSLAEEYEQTLLEFQDITEAAESFIKNNIVTNSLEELQEEMQRYRKFFVNLNHCKMILESLESNLDPITRQKHAELHSCLYHKTASILEKAVDKAAKLAQAASVWTILQKEMRNESQWLQIAQQRVPDLQNVSSEDFEQFITLYESLHQDIVYHHAKMIQQNEVAKKLQENVSAPILEKDSNEALTVIVQLREEVSLYLNMLIKFKLHWNNYNNSADKLGEWTCSCQKTLCEIHIPSNLVETSVEDMRNFWEIKAQYEVLNNKIYKSACDSFDRALSTINISDEPLQRQLHGQLLENWLDVSSTISQIQTNISESMKTDSTTVGDKIAFIEQELQEISALFNNTKGVLKSHEDLYAYIEKIQMLRTRIHLIDSELGQIALGADSNTEKISDMFEFSRNVSQQINEEHEAAEIFYNILEDIQNGIKEEEMHLDRISKILDSTHVNCKRPDVQKSLDDCIECQLLLSDSWTKLMRLRQMLHTLPMNLKVSVSPLQTERDLSLLQTMHNDLEHKCENIIIQLKNRLTLWNKFHRQLEMIQDHIQETEFMMELMQLQENADYQRLLTATERLDALLIEIDSRKNTVEDLKSIAQPLIETSDESVSLEIQETVQKITVVWQNTRENLKELCQRYEKAVKLWQHYHDVCKDVKHWVEHEASDSDTLEYMKEISQLEMYQKLIVDKKKDLEQLKDLVNNINVQVGFNVTGPLTLEIEDFSNKIEEIEHNVSSQKFNIESKSHKCDENQSVLHQAQQLFNKLQQSSQDPDFNTDLEMKIKHLREYMINLCATESRLEDILNGNKSGNLPESEVKNLHLISQSLMQDSLEQYQGMTQKIILHGNDDDFINFWDSYMLFVQTFLEQDIPCDDTELRKQRNQYSLIAYLLKDLRTLIMKKNSIHMTHADKYNCLNQQHSDYINTVENRLVEIESRLQHWDKYNRIKVSLKERMTYIERVKYSLQLEYISLKEISKMKNKVYDLQVTFQQIEQDIEAMQREASEILIFTKDEHIMIQIQSDHGRLSQQASKLKESIETWIEFLTRIENLHEHFHSECDQIQNNLMELNRCLEEVKIDSLGASQHHLNMLKNEQLRLAGIKDTLTNTNEIRDELKQRISIFDAKLIHQRLWQLWQMFEKLDYSLSVLLKQMQERLQNLKLFSHQYTILTNWMKEFEIRINDSNKYQTCEDDAMFIKSVEELLLQELLLKENEVEWFNIIGSDLVNNLQKGEEQQEIQTKLELLNSNWRKLKTHCHNRTQKIQEVNSTTISLQRRIEEIKAWMNKIEHDLKSPFLFEGLDDSTLNKLLDQYDNLQRSIESNSGNVGEVLNLCEMLFTDVESWNVHIDRKHVLHDINNLELRWKNICLESTKRKQDLLSIWNMLLEIEKIIHSHQEWVEKCNRYLDTLENLCQSSVNIENISEILEELAIRNADMIAQEPISNILRKLFVSLNKHERVDAGNMRRVTIVAKQILAIWECLLWRSNKLKKEISELQSMYTVFINEYENIIMALTQIDVQVTNIKHLYGAPDNTPEIKRKRLRDLHNELRFVINLFDKQDELGTVLMEKLSTPNSIQMKMQEYHDFANNIKISLDTLLSETIQESDKQKNQLSSQIQTEIYEKDSAVQVNTLPALSRGKSITAKEAYQYQLESALVEAREHLENLHKAISEINVNNFMTSTQKVSKVSAACESSIELIKHLNLMVLSESQGNDDDTMSVLVNIECDKFTQYQTEWRTKQHKLEELSNDDYLTCPLCTNRNWQQIDNDLWRLEQWLQMAEASQKSQHTNPPTDIDTLEDTIQDHREFLLDLDSHKSIVKSLNIVGEHLATHTLDTEKALRLRERLQADNQRWEKVCSQASHWQSQLHHALMDNKEFHRTVTELCAWLEQTENKIKSSEPIDLTSDMKLIERKYKTFRELRSDLVRCEPRVVSLQETTSQLTKYLEANKSQQFDEIYAKLTDLRLRFHSIRRLVEMYTIKIAAALGYDPTFETSSIASVNTQLQGGSLTSVAGQESNANAQEEDDEEHINTTVLTRSYRFLGRVVRASLPIQAMLLLLLGVVTLMPHGEDYSCSLTNNFARSLEPMLRYPNGPPPI